MKKFVCILLFIGTSLSAQENRFERIKAYKTAFITQQLQLTSSEAEKFWPVYNQFDQKMQDIRITERTEIFGKLKNGIDNLSDVEINAIIDKDLSLKTEELELKKQLVVNLKKVLAPKKIVKLTKAEEDFKRKLLQRYREGQGTNGQKGPK